MQTKRRIGVRSMPLGRTIMFFHKSIIMNKETYNMDINIYNHKMMNRVANAAWQLALDQELNTVEDVECYVEGKISTDSWSIYMQTVELACELIGLDYCDEMS